MQDPQGNHLARVVFPEKTTQFEVVVDLVADMATINPFDFFLEPEAENWPFAYDPRSPRSSRRSAELEAAGPAADGMARQGPARSKQRTVDMLVDLNARLQRTSATSCAWSRASGRRRRRWQLPRAPAATPPGCWCRSLRHLGFAARFASGYLIQLVADEKPLDGPEGPTARLHRPPCLVRGLPAGRRLGRPRPDLRPV